MAKSKSSDTQTYKGRGIGNGTATGRAVVISDFRRLRGRIKQGDVIITHMTTPEIIPALPKIAGLVTEVGGVTCHAAVIAREYGIPGVVSCELAMTNIPNGCLVSLNGETGEVTVHGDTEEDKE